MCRRGPPARNLRHFLFFSPLSPLPLSFISLPLSLFLFSSSFSSPYPRIFFLLPLLLPSPLVSGSSLSLSLPPRTQSLFLSIRVGSRPLLRIYESTRLYKWTHCSFLGQRVARGSLLSFAKGVVFRCRAPPRERDNRK